MTDPLADIITQALRDPLTTTEAIALVRAHIAAVLDAEESNASLNGSLYGMKMIANLRATLLGTSDD